jgi:hypothetical protein
MTLPFAIPPWVPWWVPLLVLIPAILYALVLFVMPFSVIGLKSRIDALDERLEDIQLELRALVQRLPEPIVGRGFEDTGYTPPPNFAGSPHPAPGVAAGPPIPPAPLVAGRNPGLDEAGRGRSGERRSGRAEPRLDWPR